MDASAGQWLHAGPVEALLIDGDLRYLRRDGIEIARRVQVAVRSADWGTVAGELTDLSVEQDTDRFRVGFGSAHRHAGLEFAWRCEIAGDADGTVTYTMDGTAAADSPYRRIGLCVLHPTEVYAGAPYRAESADGHSDGTLPATIAPQLFDGDTYPPLFAAFDRLQMTSREGLSVRFRFDGELFEMEDQRNWTDASFKTYGRNPPARIEPWLLPRGTRVRQQVTISSAPESAAAPRTARRAAAVTLGAAVTGRMPALGVALAADERHGPAEIEHLRTLGPAHLRVDVHLGNSGWRDRLDAGVSVAAQLGCPVELAVFATAASEFTELAERLAASAPPARVIVLGEGLERTPGELVDAARAALRGGMPIGGGTDLNFAEVNRHGPVPAAYELVAYPANPQVHSGDDLSVMETPVAQADTVRRAHELAPGVQVAVTPITLRPRFNPDAPPGSPPDNVDPRQSRPITAAWTLASIRHLAGAGATSATYFETLGPRGLLEPGRLFPVYHLLAELAPLSGMELLHCRSSRPLELEAIHVRHHTGTVVIAANLTPAAVSVPVGPTPTGETLQLDLPGYGWAALR